jgi:hypothetical protein
MFINKILLFKVAINLKSAVADNSNKLGVWSEELFLR